VESDLYPLLHDKGIDGIYRIPYKKKVYAPGNSDKAYKMLQNNHKSGDSVLITAIGFVKNVLTKFEGGEKGDIGLV